MPMYRFHMRARSAAKETQGAADLVRYLQREGEFAPKDRTEEREVASLTRSGADTAHYDDLVGPPVVGNLPSWAQNNAGTYFAAASRYERVNGQYAIALQIALPRELSHEQHMALARDFLDATMHDKPYLLVKHEPFRDGQPQPHLHIVVGPRIEDGIRRSVLQQFRRYNSQHPERGGAQKDRFWNQRQAPQRLREAFADLANSHLERAGVETRIDPRSLRKQGIERDRISWQTTDRPDATTRAREQQQAAVAWEQRKASKDLGDIRAMSREAFVLQVQQWTRDYEPGREVPRSSREVVRAYEHREARRLHREGQQQEREVARLARYAQRLEHEARLLDRGEQRSRELAQVLADGERLGVTPGRERTGLDRGGRLGPVRLRTPRDRDPRGGRVARGRVFEEEREHH